MLQALYELAHDEGLLDDPDFEPKPVAWLIRVGDGGKLISIEGTHTLPPITGKKKPKPVAKIFRIPRQPTGRSGTKAPAAFFVDNAKYVFGISTAEKSVSREEGAEKSSWFRNLIEKCASSTDDDGVRAIVRFLENVANGKQAISLPELCKSNDLFAFVYSPDVDRLVHDRPKVREYWARQRAQPKHESSQVDHSDRICLVTGKPIGNVPLFPLIKRVPGGTSSGVGLVSFNKNAFESHGWDGNENAPISEEAANACRDALNRLLDPAYADPKNPGQTLPKRHIRLSDDTIVCFWGRGKKAGQLADLLDDLLNVNDPEQVGDLYRSLWTGREVIINDPSVFYAVTLSGTQGRVIVRDWFKTTVGEVATNLKRYREDLAMVRNTPKPKNSPLANELPLRVLLRSLAPLGEEKNIPDPLAAQLVSAALRGQPFPYAVLQKAIERSRAEIGRSEWADLERRDGRAALIKAVLIRRTQHQIGVAMNPRTLSEGYNLGCLMAVLERLQEAALENVNASVIDRYFGAASATPRSVFVRLLRNAQHHARKARDSEKNSGLAFLLKKLVDEFASRFQVDTQKRGYASATGIPAFLPLDQQGLFVLGYHQMRKWLWMTKDERTQWNQENLDAPNAFQWSSKAEPQPADA